MQSAAYQWRKERHSNGDQHTCGEADSRLRVGEELRQGLLKVQDLLWKR